MLRETDVFEAQGFSFADHGEQSAPALVSVEGGADGATATIPDAHLLFNSDFVRAGTDLHLNGHDGDRAIVRDYFTSAERVALMSREGARLSPDIVDALTSAVAPGQYAQAGQTPPAANDAVGRVVTASADSTILRNGVPVTVRPGDPVLRADVLQTAGGTMAVTFNDGSTLNLTANTRIVVSEFVYSPNGAGNSQLLDLVQGSLTFISGEVAHSGNMSIGTPVATMGIRGTVGGVTTASDGTVQFYVSQSATGAVIINAQGQIIANVVQDGPLIVVRPVGPLEVVAEEIGKSPQQLAVELQALQQIVSIKAVGDQLLQQFFQQQQPNPNPQSPNGPHTQIQVDDKLKITLISNDGAGDGSYTPPTHAVIETILNNPDAPPSIITVPIPVNLPPIVFSPRAVTGQEDTALTFGGARAISIIDNDSSTLTVTLSVTNGVLALATLAGLTFSSGGSGQAAMTFSGSPAAINAALNGLTYTPAQDYSGSAVLSITKTDGNSAPTTTTVGITVEEVNDAPVLNFFNLNIDDDEPVVLTPADYSVTDPDGPQVIFTVTNVTGGEFVVDQGENMMSFSQSNDCGSVTFTADEIAAGRVKFVPDGSGDPVSYSISVSDGIASSTPAVDHQPQAVDIEAEVTAGSAASSYNIVIVLDVSGSMDGQRLIDAKAAIANLLGPQNADKINSVMALSFASEANVYVNGGSHWVTASQANSYFQSRTAGGGTVYEDAILHVMGTMPTLPPPEGADKTFVYFISDGEPTGGDMGARQAQWEQFLRDEGIDTSYAIGISAAVNDVDLAPIAWDSNNPNFEPINLQSTTDLANTLQNTVLGTQNIYTDGDASLGGDGGRVLSIKVEGETYTWDGFNTVSSSSQAQWTKTAASLTVTTALGGILTFYFGDEGQAHQAGDWSYAPPETVDYSSNDVFRYTLVDNDGDKSSANITVKVYDEDGPAPTSDTVFTNATSFDIPDWVLLRNDNDPNGFLSVTDAEFKSGSPMGVGHDDGQVTLAQVAVASTGSFEYEASYANENTATAEVTVNRVSDATLATGLGGRTEDTIIIADDSGVSMAGGSGSDILIGGAGDDTMTGNGAGDVFVFKQGGGEDTVTDFVQTGEVRDVIALDGFSFTSYEDFLQSVTIEDFESEGGYGAVIDFLDGNTITLLEVESADLTAADFIFHPSQSIIG